MQPSSLALTHSTVIHLTGTTDHHPSISYMFSLLLKQQVPNQPFTFNYIHCHLTKRPSVKTGGIFFRRTIFWFRRMHYRVITLLPKTFCVSFVIFASVSKGDFGRDYDFSPP